VLRDISMKKNQKGINKGPHNKTGGDLKIIKKLKIKKIIKTKKKRKERGNLKNKKSLLISFLCLLFSSFSFLRLSAMLFKF